MPFLLTALRMPANKVINFNSKNGILNSIDYSKKITLNIEQSKLNLNHDFEIDNSHGNLEKIPRFKTIEEYITAKIKPYIGKTQLEILREITGKTYAEKIPKQISKMISDILIGKDNELYKKDELFTKTNYIIKNLPVNEIIKDGENGFLAEDGVEALAEKMQQLMSDQELRQCMGKAAHESMKQYAAENIWGQWEELIDRGLYV